MQAGQTEMNVTPLIDVLLVLLIIFMVITPLTPRGLAADLPVASDSPPNETPIVLAIAANEQLSINGHPVASDTLAAAISDLYSSRANKVLFVGGDKSLEYRQIAQLIDLVRGVRSDIQVGLMP